MSPSRYISACLLIWSSVLPCALAEVTPQADYNLKGAGGIRDTLCPPVLKDQTGKSPDLVRQGTPKVMSNGPECRRQEYDSSIKFEAADQCYSAPVVLVQGDNFVVETWVYAAKAADPDYHLAVVNGNGGTGFSFCQHGENWEVLIGGVGGVVLDKVVPATWTHLAVVKSAGMASGWVNGRKVCKLPDVGGGAANFSIGAALPGKEPFSGWIAEVRYSTFKPGKFDPALDFLLDVQKTKAIQAGEMAKRVQTVEAILKTPGVQAVATLDEHAYGADWLLAPPTTPVTVQALADSRKQSVKVMLSNGLVSRTFLVSENLACISFRRSDKKLEFVRAVKPEVRFRADGGGWVEVGGMTGTPDKSYLLNEWLDALESKAGAFHFSGMTLGAPVKAYEWHPKCNSLDLPWPAKGTRLTFHFEPPADAQGAIKDLVVDVNYELYDGLPVMMKTFSIRSKSGKETIINEINGECLAVCQDTIGLMHVESDYTCAFVNLTDEGSALGIHAGKPHTNPYYDYQLGGGAVRWEYDPEYNSYASLNPAEDLFLKNPQKCLLTTRPPTGPGCALTAGGEFQALRTFEVLNDTTEKERQFLAQRRMYARLAPQTTEYQIELHSPTHDVQSLKRSIDQMAEMGFDRLQIEHPVGINYADISEGNVKWLKEVCDYGKSKRIRVGAYQLIMGSQSAGAENDCIDPNTLKPGSLYGQSWCAGSNYANLYRTNMFKLMDATGLASFDPDGGYCGEPCASKTHPGHKGLEDSIWMQWEHYREILHECQRRNVYVTNPDWYFWDGQVCTGMGYREASDEFPIALQTMIHRQYMFDATYHKTAGMGWMNFNLGTLRGGMEKNLGKYEFKLFQMLGYGAQTWLRGDTLYDGPESKAMVKRTVEWAVKYREIIRGDLIHLRRPDGKSLDYVMHVRPGNKEKGMLLVFNPTGDPITETLHLPLYYTGLPDKARIREREGQSKEYILSRDYKIQYPVTIPAGGYSWFIIE